MISISIISISIITITVVKLWILCVVINLISVLFLNPIKLSNVNDNFVFGYTCKPYFDIYSKIFGEQPIASCNFLDVDLLNPQKHQTVSVCHGDDPSQPRCF